MDKEIAGQPLWLWLAGAGIVIVGYLWFKSHSQQQAPAQSGGTNKSTSTSSFKEWITQHQAPSTTHKHPRSPGLPPVGGNVGFTPTGGA